MAFISAGSGQFVERVCQILCALLLADHLSRVVCQQAALVQNQHLVLLLNLFNQVRGPEYGQPIFLAQGPNVFVECPSAGDIEAYGGLVQQ